MLIDGLPKTRFRPGGKSANIRRGDAKVDADKVRSIRASKEPYGVIAERFGISVNCVSEIKRRKTWRFVE